MTGQCFLYANTSYLAGMLTPHTKQGIFLLSFDGGLKIFGPRRSPMGTKSDGGGGTCKKNPTEAKTAHLMQN